MSLGYFNYPAPGNEPVLNYGPGSREKEILKKTLKELKRKEHDIPMFIGGKEVRSGKKIAIRPPHEIAHTLGHFHEGDETHVQRRPSMQRCKQGRLGIACHQLGEPETPLFLKKCRSDRHEVPLLYERHHHAGAEQECLPGGNRQRL